MKENLKQFLQQADEDRELGNTLKALIQANEPDLIEKVIALADKQGIVLVEEDFVTAQDLSLDELNKVAGGSYLDESDCFIAAAALDNCGWWGGQH